METLRNRIVRNFRIDNTSTRTSNTEITTASSTADETNTGTVVDLQQQTISEFLTNAERIASLSTSSSTSSNSLISKSKRKAGDSAVGPSKGRQKRSTNDDSHRRDGKDKQSRRQKKHNKQQKKQQQQEKHYDNNDIDNDTKNKPLQHDDDSIPIVDEALVKAVIDHDEQLNREVTELFQMDLFFGDEHSSSFGSEDGDDEKDWDCDKIKNSMSGCMFLQ